MKVLHNSCNTVTRALPDSYVHPQPSGQVYISGRALMPVLQLLNVASCVNCQFSLVFSFYAMFERWLIKTFLPAPL